MLKNLTKYSCSTCSLHLYLKADVLTPHGLSQPGKKFILDKESRNECTCVCWCARAQPEKKFIVLDKRTRNMLFCKNARIYVCVRLCVCACVPVAVGTHAYMRLHARSGCLQMWVCARLCWRMYVCAWACAIAACEFTCACGEKPIVCLYTSCCIDFLFFFPFFSCP